MVRVVLVYRCRMAGIGEHQLARAGIEDPDDERGHVVGAVDLDEELVELFQDGGRIPAVPGVGPEGIAELAHERRGGDPFADDVTHDETDGAVAQGDDVVPVSADVEEGTGGRRLRVLRHHPHRVRTAPSPTPGTGRTLDDCRRDRYRRVTSSLSFGCSSFSLTRPGPVPLALTFEILVPGQDAEVMLGAPTLPHTVPEIAVGH